MVALDVAAAIVLGLLVGSELNVGAFLHPTLARLRHDAHIESRAAFARLFGKVMPGWMITSTRLNLLLLFTFARLSHKGWDLAAIAFGLQVFSLFFSVIAPVPINNRVAKWTATSLPSDWQAQIRRWDQHHAFRTLVLLIAFTLLIVAVLI